MLTTNYQIKEPKNPAYTQIVTRTGTFTGLSFKQTKESDIRKTNYLSSVPNISFSFDYGTVIFDYGESNNSNDKELVKSLFYKLSPGSNFTVTQANFLIEDDASSADLSGTYSFVRLIGSSVVATPVSVTSINNRITIYKNKHFLSIPQIGTSISAKSTNIYYVITNSLLSDKISSFTNFGIYPNDLIKISGSLNNNKLFKVLSVNNNSDGSESVIVESEVIDEICFGLPLTLELIQTGPYTLAGPENNSSKIVGACNLIFSDNTSLCYRNHTENQCIIRGSEKNSSSVRWIKGISCSSNLQSLTSVVTPRTVAIPNVLNTPIISINNRAILSTGTSQTETASAD